MKTAWILAIALTLGTVTLAGAQTWPSKPVTMVLGYPAGSGIDIVARYLADSLRERTGQPFIVDNKPGSFANIGAQAVARAAPDGYTMFFTTTSTHAANIHLYKSIGYDPVKDFTPITTIATLGFVVLVNPSKVPVSSVSELTGFVLARPGKVSYGSASATGRIAAELYQSMTGTNMTFIPYKGGQQALLDLLGGDIQVLYLDATAAIPHMNAGKVRALAVTNANRISAAPEVPTMAQAGLAGYELESWFAVFFPAKAPRDITQKLAELCNASMTSEKGRAFLTKLGADPYTGSPESLAKLVEKDLAKWGKIIKSAGIEPE